MSKRGEMVAAHLAALVGDVPLALAPFRATQLRGVLMGATAVDAGLTQAEMRGLAAMHEAPGSFAVTEDGIAVIPVRGTMVKRGDAIDALFGLTGYDLLEQQLGLAASNPQVRGVLLDVDSPGGSVNGAFEVATAVRTLGKPVVAVANEHAYSAAYLIASAADHLVVPTLGGVGSIGVIAIRLDASRAEKDAGYEWEIITTGARKADGFPPNPMSDGERTALQAKVDRAGDLLFATVAEQRSTTPDALRALEAGTFDGPEAVANGLADQEGTLADGFAALRGRLGGTTHSPGRVAATQTEASMADTDTAATGTDSNVVSMDEHRTQLDAATTAARDAAKQETQAISALCATIKRPVQLNGATKQPGELVAHFVAAGSSLPEVQAALLDALAADADAAGITGHAADASAAAPKTEIGMDQVDGYYAKRRAATAAAMAKRPQPVVA